MSRVKEKYLEFGKDLYTQYDTEGNKLYSLQEIADRLCEKFNKRFTRQTIFNWSKSNDWDGLNQKIKQHAISKANEADKFSPDEKVIDARSDDLADVYKYGKLMASIGTDVLQKAYKAGKGDKSVKKNSEITVKEAIAAMRTGSNIVFRLNDVPDPEAGGAGIVMIPDNGR